MAACDDSYVCVPRAIAQYVMGLLLLLNYIFSVLGLILFQVNDPQHFGSLEKAMLTVWQVETFDSWLSGGEQRRACGCALSVRRRSRTSQGTR